MTHIKDVVRDPKEKDKYKKISNIAMGSDQIIQS